MYAPLFDMETHFVAPCVLTLLYRTFFVSRVFSQEFNDFVVRCLEKKPEERPTSRALLRVSVLLVLVSDIALQITRQKLGLLIDMFFLSVLGWYIPGISELPLAHRLLLLLAGEIFFSFLFCVRACNQSTAPRASAAPSRVSASAGG